MLREDYFITKMMEDIDEAIILVARIGIDSHIDEN